MRILIAEDDPFSRRLLSRTVEPWGYEPVVACDGEEALEKLQAQDAPRLALIDWMMPVLDGPEVCRRIRHDRPDRLTYLIMLTAKENTEDLVEAINAGADDFISKSFDVRELEVRLRAARRIIELESTLRQMATRDTLTDLWNRPAILDMLRREVSRSRRQGRCLAVMMADIDHFKQVNDAHGHAAGDAVLVEIAQRMRTELRDYDSLGRYGGEEFLIVLPEPAAAEAASIAERLRRRVCGEPIALGGEALTMTISFGVAVAADGIGVEAERLLHAADAALYEAKRAGRNQVRSAPARVQAAAAKT